MFARTFTIDDRQYSFDVALDDAAITDESLAIDVRAVMRRREGAGWTDWYEVKLRAELLAGDELIVVKHDDRVIGQVRLDTEVPHDESFDGSRLDIEAEDAALAPAFSSFDWGEAIDAIPAGDPVFGCLIRGAVSTVVGQTIRCWQQVGAQERLQERTWKVLGCLRESGLKMSFTFVYRVGKCVAKAGF